MRRPDCGALGLTLAWALATLACGDAPGRDAEGSAPGITSVSPTGDDTGAETGSASEGTTAATGGWNPGSSGSAPEDDAAVDGHTLPAAAVCGEPLSPVSVTLRNTGDTTWSRADDYELGAVDDDDPLSAAVRIQLPEGVTVAPGETHEFSLSLAAPDAAGEYHTDWQMVRGDAQWFGDQASADVDIECVPDGPPPLPADFEGVVWLHQDVSGWPVTMTLDSVTFEGSLICLNHGSQSEGVYVWPEKLLGGEGDTWVVGNPWVFIHREDTWYAATWEWLRPNQTCKAVTSVAGDHIKVAPFDAQSGWTPRSGERLYFMVSALARWQGFTNVSERSDPIEVVWP